MNWWLRVYHAQTHLVPEPERVKLRVVNLLAALGVALSLVYTLVYGAVFRSPEAVALNLLFVLAYLVYFVWLKRAAWRISRVWLVGVFVLQMASFALWIFPRTSGMHLFVIAGIPLSFLVFGHTDRWLRLVAVLLLLAVFFVAETQDSPKLLEHLPLAYYRATYLTVVPLLTVLLAVVLQSFLNELHQRDEALRQLAITDPLTGVANRRGFLERAARMLARAQREQTPLCVVMVDIDHFKTVNDRNGHQSGDQLLAAVAQALRDGTRAEDAVGRVGGEEFALVLSGTTLAEGLQAAEQLRQRVGQIELAHPQGGMLGCTVSMGVSAPAATEMGLEPALARADKALYRAKTMGRNRVCSAQQAAGAAA